LFKTEVEHPLLMLWILIRGCKILTQNQVNLSTFILDNQLNTDIEFDASTLLLLMNKIEQALNTIQDSEHVSILLI
jgi:hypothetical protein